jgi:hypothetical protein
VEASQVRRRVLTTITHARQRARERVQVVADAERAYVRLLHEIATPLAHQLASVLKAEGYPCTVFTPGRSLRLSLDRSRDDFVELSLDTGIDPPRIVSHTRRTRGSRTIEEERPIKPDAPLDAVGEDDVLDVLLEAVEAWVAR